MKVLHITTFMESSPVGGMESVVYHLSKELGGRGHRITVLVPSKESVIKKQKNSRFKTFYIPSIELNDRLIFPLRLNPVRKLIRKNDVVHLHSPHGFFTLSLGFLTKFERKPLITSVLAYLDLLKHPNTLVRTAALPLEALASMLIKTSDIIHVKNALDYAKLSRIHRNVIYVPDGIPSYYFNKDSHPEQIRRKLKINDANLILYVGRLHPLKGPQVLVKAMRYIIKREPRTLAIIVGPDRGYLRTLKNLVRELNLEKYVVFAGILNEEEKLSAYDAANVVVIPSLSDVVEAFSIVASEAWARRTTVVASAVGALKYRVRNGVNGYLAKPGNEKNLAENILKALENPKIKSIPKDVWTWNQVADLMESLYKEVVGHCQSTS